MFLLHCLAVFTAAFWMSALVAQLALRSPEEQALSPGVRVGFGFAWVSVPTLEISGG